VAEALVAPDAEEYEWLELMNVGPGTLDMTPVRLTKGVDFDFAGSAVTSLSPGGRVVVVKNINAWNARYGASFPGALVAGSWQTGQSLSNGGEQLKVSFGAGTAIRDFSYDDVSPWPDGADGTGHGLVLTNPAARPDHGDGTQWRLSVQRHGAPGQSDRLAYSTWAGGFGGLAAEVDSDGDGFTNLAEYALGTMPNSMASQPVVAASIDTVNAVHYLTLSFRQRLGTDDAVVAAEVSGSLDAWNGSPAAVVLASAQPNGDGTATMVYRSVTPIEAGQREFLRLRISSPGS
jgi:hypothetical protein